MRYLWQFLATQATETFKLRKSWTIWTATTYGSADSDQPPYTVRCCTKIGTPTRYQQLGDSISSLSVWTERHFIFTALCDVDICCAYSFCNKTVCHDQTWPIHQVNSKSADTYCHLDVCPGSCALSFSAIFILWFEIKTSKHLNTLIEFNVVCNEVPERSLSSTTFLASQPLYECKIVAKEMFKHRKRAQWMAGY